MEISEHQLDQEIMDNWDLLTPIEKNILNLLGLDPNKSSRGESKTKEEKKEENNTTIFR